MGKKSADDQPCMDLIYEDLIFVIYFFKDIIEILKNKDKTEKGKPFSVFLFNSISTYSDYA